MAFLDLCRLCGTDTRDMVRNAIFEGEERNNKYALKIAECLTLQVTEEDDLPKVMCSKCTRKLESLSDFRDEAYQTETHLLSMIHDLKKLKTELPDDSESWDLEIRSGDGGSDHTNQSIPELEQQINKEENPIAQTPAHRYSTRQSKLKQPPVLANKDDLHSGSPRLELKKGARKRPATQISSTKESVKEAPPTKRARQPKQATPPTSPASPPTSTVTASTPAAAPLKVNSRPPDVSTSFRCLVCRKKFRLEADVVQHKRTCTSQPQAPAPPSIQIECPTCKVPFSDLQERNAHVLKVHSQGWSPNDNQPLEFQKRWKPPALFCNLCGKQFKTNFDFGEHKEQHQTGVLGTVRCLYKDCSESVQAEHFKKHTDQHKSLEERAKIPLLQCDFCGVKMQSKERLRAHLMTHLETLASAPKAWQPEVPCPTCGWTFSDQSELQLHLPRHRLAASLWQCLYLPCTQPYFTSEPEVQKHVGETHQMDRLKTKQQLRRDPKVFAYACDVSGCTFRAGVSHKLFLHRQSAHASVCDTCGKTVKLPRSFARHCSMHAKSGTPGMLRCSYFECKHLTFASADELKRHMPRHFTNGQHMSNFACDFKNCGEEFESFKSVKDHKQRVHCSLYVTCSVCDKLLSKYNLTNHMKIHEYSWKQEIAKQSVKIESL